MATMTGEEELAAAFVAFVRARPDHPAVVKLRTALVEYEVARRELSADD